MRFMFAALLWLITFSSVDVASAQTPDELEVTRVTKQCQKGDAGGCTNLGYAYAKGTGVTQDDFKAVEFYRKACDGKNATGCNNLGVSYHTGDGVRQSVEDALRFYGQACDLKDKDGCQNYARLKTEKK